MLADTIGQESELADTDQTSRQYVQQKAADELDRLQGHDLGAAVIPIILPVKADAAVFQRSKAVVGNSHAVSVAGQILEDPLGSPEGWLSVDHPFDGSGLLTQELEGRWIGQGLQSA